MYGRGRGIHSHSQDVGTSATGVWSHFNDRIKMQSNRSQNNLQKFNISPTSITVNLAMDENTSAWFAHFKNYWNLLKKSPTVVDMLHQHFETCNNPYEQVLMLTYNCLDFKDAKPKTLAYLIMEEFHHWCSRWNERIAHLLTVQIKISAFNVVRQQRSFVLMKLTAVVYQMARDSDVFLECVHSLVDEKQYKEASQCAILLGLQEKFKIVDFLLPLLLQDKLICIDEFLVESPMHQVELVTFMDSVLGQQGAVYNAIEPLVSQHNIPDVKWNKLHNKPWGKLITRFVKMFNLSPDLTPNLNRKRNEGALQFLLHKRYAQNGFSDESWKEMVSEAVKDDKRLQQELVCQVSAFGDAAEALKWAQFYNIDYANWPYNVRMYHDHPDEDRHVQQRSHNDHQRDLWTDLSTAPDAVKYHELRLPRSAVHLVDDFSSFEHFLFAGLQGVNVVGVDSEWKPSFGIHNNELSLLQIATRQRVFILDVIKLNNSPTVIHLWKQLNEMLFNNSDVLKLGFNISSDLLMLRQSLPHLGMTQGAGFLDLLSLWKQVERNSRVKLPYPVESGGYSLNMLVQKCLGRPLDKSDQFSNWENRPLRDSQLFYAALDAFCLIEVYDVLRMCSERAGLPFQDTCNHLLSSRQPRKKNKKFPNAKHQHRKSHTWQRQPSSPHYEPVPADRIKIVCDTMLQGLGKSLRRCGIDTAILENNQDHMECVRLANDEHRYILTRCSVFEQLNGCVPSGHCFHVIPDDIDEQLKQVLDYYKVVVTKDHVFSRCQSCNSNSFIKLSRSTMNAVVVAGKNLQVAPPAEYHEEYLNEEATGFSSDEDYFEEARPPPTASCTKKWDLCSDEHVDVGLCKTSQGARIQTDVIPSDILEKVDLFYVCEHCGKVYWDGSHLDKVLAGRLQGIVRF